MRVGDIRIRYFGLPVVREATLSHVGVSLDVFAPSGDEDKGLGSGSWVMAPGILFGIAASDTLNFYPIVSYQYSPSAVNCTADGSDAGGCIPPGPGESDGNGTTQGVSVEIMSVFGLPNGMWVQLIPKYSEVFDGPESRSLNLRVNYGWMLRENLSLTADVLHEFDNRDGLQNHVRVGVGITSEPSKDAVRLSVDAADRTRRVAFLSILPAPDENALTVARAG